MPAAMRTALSLARAAAGLLPDWAKAAVYRTPGVSHAARWLLTRAAPGEPVVVEVAGGLARGLRLRVDLKTQKYYWLGTHEMPVQRALEREVRPGAIVYDAGAHLGFFALALARVVGPQGRVVAFEPLPANVPRLRENVSLNPALAANVVVVEAAVAEVSGRVTLDADASPTQARLGEPAPHPAGTYEVESVTLDEFVFARRQPAPQLVKMDVEGAEGRALAGARRLLREAKPLLLVEVHGEEAARAVWDELRAADYQVFSLERDREFRAPQEFAAGHILALPRRPATA